MSLREHTFHQHLAREPYPRAPSDMRIILDAVTNHWRLVTVSVAVAFLAAAAFLILSPPWFTASARILLDTRPAQLVQQQRVSENATPDSAAIESQVEIIKSETIAKEVLRKLDLHDATQLSGAGSRTGFLAADWLEAMARSINDLFRAMFIPIADNGPTDQQREALELFEKRLSAQRVGLTYVVEISFTAQSPDLAAQIANAVASAYIDDQMEARYTVARRAKDWFAAHSAELSRQVEAAEKAIADYQARNRGGSESERLALRNLANSAQTYRNLYDSFFQRMTEANQEQTYSITEARIITQAAAPLRRSYPKTIVTLVGALGVGLLSGVGISLLKQARSKEA